MPKLLFKSFTIFAVILAVQIFAVESPKVVIWKFDDVRAGEKARLLPGFKRVSDWAVKNKTVISMGVICDSLANPNVEDVAWIKKNAIENGGCIEFWLHGWDHKKIKKSDGTDGSEFNGSDLETQKKHFKDACDIFNKNTQLTFNTFGAPYNQNDENTATAMDACPNLTNWFFGPKDKKRIILGRSINMEVATGKVSYDKFMEAYKAKTPAGPMVLQGHVGQWDDQSYNDFVKIADFLSKEGWVAKTPRSFVQASKK
jgi:Uncharacterized protein conserved in bacteria (DUF2334)